MDKRLTCQICKKTFSTKSSLIRHSKGCTPGPAPSLRQRSCRSCTTTKIKCDLQRPQCSECIQRGRTCEYIVPLTRNVRKRADVSGDANKLPSDNMEGESGGFVSVADAAAMSPTPTMQDLSLAYTQNINTTNTAYNLDMCLANLDFLNDPMNTNLSTFDLLPNKDPLADLRLTYASALDHTTRFSPTTDLGFGPIASAQGAQFSLDSTAYDAPNFSLWNPGCAKAAPLLVRHSMETLFRVIKTWPKALVKGIQVPPMFHATHMRENMLWPMVNCMAIARMWVEQSADATEVVRQAVLQEMGVLFGQYYSMDERYLLSALQALVMYTVILMFPGKGQISVALVDPAVFLCIQRFVGHVAETGLFLTEERDMTQPPWESWVHVTAKRRAVVTMYLLHWSYSVYHDLPSFRCSQLGFMPAPAPKFLWQAETRDKWASLYPRWLAQWGNYPYMMSEFADIQPGTALEPRTERWLEDADEFSIMFFSIVNATEREDPVHDYSCGGIPVLAD